MPFCSSSSSSGPTMKLALVISLLLSRKRYTLKHSDTWSLMHNIFILSPYSIKLQFASLQVLVLYVFLFAAVLSKQYLYKTGTLTIAGYPASRYKCIHNPISLHLWMLNACYYCCMLDKQILHRAFLALLYTWLSFPCALMWSGATERVWPTDGSWLQLDPLLQANS